jgi:hypothetical protein
MSKYWESNSNKNKANCKIKFERILLYSTVYALESNNAFLKFPFNPRRIYHRKTSQNQ